MSDRIQEMRLKTILLYLAEVDESVTLHQIAARADVSRRTVMRELATAEEWLGAHRFRLLKKPGSGVSLDGGASERERLKQLLSEGETEVVNMPRDRQKLLLAELLREKEPVKLFNFTKRLGVSVSTISNDLDKVAEWLSAYDLALIRKPGLGVYVHGDEKDFRRAMITLLYENLSEEELLRLIKDTVPQRKESTLQSNVRSRLLNLIDRKTIDQIEQMISRMESTLSYKLADSASIGLMVHLALAIQRLKNNDRISIAPLLLEELRQEPEFAQATLVVNEVRDTFQLEVPEDEIGYITMHLKGARAYQTTQLVPVSGRDLDLLVDDMIRRVSVATGLALEYDSRLRADLVSHLEPALRRLEFSLDIRNPLLEKLKQLFPEVYRMSCQAANVLKERLGKEIPESEIGYLAMHFAAAMEKSRQTAPRIRRIAVTCPSGFGSSRLLSVRLQKEFPELEIIDVISVQELTPSWLRENEVDFVVSTIPLEDCAVGNMAVNPLLLGEDRDRLHTVLRAGNARSADPEHKTGITDFRDSLRQVSDYSDLLLSVLSHLQVCFFPLSGAEWRRRLFWKMYPDTSDATLLEKLRTQLGESGMFPIRMAVLESKHDTSPGLWLFVSDKCTDPGKTPETTVSVLVGPEGRQTAMAELAADLESMLAGTDSVLYRARETGTAGVTSWIRAQLKKLYLDKMGKWQNNMEHMVE